MAATIPFITTEQMIEVDRAMIEDYHIDLVQMMENAGRNLAHLARQQFLDGSPQNKTIIVLAGRGGNGGGALVCARRLHNWGASVHVFLTKSRKSFTGVPAHQLDILDRMNIPLIFGKIPLAIGKTHLIVDGLIGYSLSGAPRGLTAKLIEWANVQPAPVLALDVPSGIDATKGIALRPCIIADATLTLALPKIGFKSPAIRKNIGKLFLADISVPPELFIKAGITGRIKHVFTQEDIIRVKFSAETNSKI
ncbi:MAG: NAD(P)H-hydrate epimerase [Actinobacteria bacterium]|nr:NAD(P)H-hydrate epimerase [Actinomycetota bacterium]